MRGLKWTTAFVGVLGLVVLAGLFMQPPFVARMVVAMEGSYYERLLQGRIIFAVVTVICAGTWVYLAPQRWRKFLGAIVLCCGCGFVVNARFRFPREPTAPRNQCINNLRLIDGAVQIWALDHGKSNGSVVVISSMATNIKFGFPKCPLGGVYTVCKVGEGPTCNVPGHTL
jgi:hypothetical protein